MNKLLLSTLLGCFLINPAFALEIDDELISCIIATESSGNPSAFNKNSGAIGLMQITNSALDDFNKWSWVTTDSKGENPLPVSDPPRYNLGDMYNPSKNVEVGTWYLWHISNRYLKGKGTLEDILICYNFGYGNWRKYKAGKKQLPSETKNYIKKIKRCLE